MKLKVYEYSVYKPDLSKQKGGAIVGSRHYRDTVRVTYKDDKIEDFAVKFAVTPAVVASLLTALITKKKA